jgi:queuosine precursor transporter
MNNFKHISTITGLFTATLLIANTLDNKIFDFFGLNLPCGIILFPLAYIFGNILTEVYGFHASRKIIWTGFFSLILMTIFYIIAGKLKPASFWAFQDDFNNILGRTPRIVLASIIAYFVGEFVNSFTISKIKAKMQGKKMGLRFVMSTIVGQAVDTSLFVIIAFAGIFNFNELISIAFSGWLFKVGWEIIALPLTIPIVNWLKKAENVDVIDNDINYNIF